MPFLVRDLILNPEEDEGLLAKKVLARFRLQRQELNLCRIVRKAVDARHKKRIKFICTVEIAVADEARFLRRHGSDPDVEAVPAESPPVFPKISATKRIIIAGFGPAGMFAALRLAEYGLTPLIVERGRPMEERIRDVRAFWNSGNLDPESNVQFGEGGAGTFSDGKLTTRVRDPNIMYVLRQLVRFGAPEEILYLAKPHIGTDRLQHVVVSLRRHLAEQGIEVRFGHRLTDLSLAPEGVRGVVINDGIEEACDFLVLAPGHSARDTYAMLHRRGVRIQPKPFSIGVRVEHPQELINSIQYGVPAHPHLPPAEYALACNLPDGRSAYSFCMCPGGMVVASSSEAGGVVTNGMSNYLRNAPYANSALVVTVGPADFPGGTPLAGVEFQRRYERAAFMAGGGEYRAPAANLMTFLGGKGPAPNSSYRPGVVEADLNAVLPSFVTGTLRQALVEFDRKMRGFITSEATLTGVETRTSAPVRVERGLDLQSVTAAGLYPTGEGAGYAGGIVSAALDGIRVADAIASSLQTPTPSGYGLL